eukprot:TRINITY_DN4664_c0_g1_i2.p1 TRINITY_DN4664_c0_g1~~TRINITY_DN4664_c0_g1_i2.p1  ORF type:complete len:326 (+),score=97.24 TRINITY_DN4664_c0_g1_i2:398-1375(+)
MICSYYYVSHSTIDLFSSSLTPKTKLKGLMEILASAMEFGSLPMRHNEDLILRQYAQHLPYSLGSGNRFTDPHTKAYILLAAHFSRKRVTADMAVDSREVITNSTRLLQAMVDVASSTGALGPALAVMELSQMVIQGVWNTDSNLYQVPHMNSKHIDAFKAVGVESVLDMIEMEEADRQKVLVNLPKEKMSDVALFCNRYPNVDVAHELMTGESAEAGDMASLAVVLDRDLDDEDPSPGNVFAPRYPQAKAEGWWLVVGDVEENSILAVKRVQLDRVAKAKIDFPVPETVGERELTLFVMCDSYLGVDQEFQFNLKITPSTEEQD